jgi:hypothetical protein
VTIIDKTYLNVNLFSYHRAVHVDATV